MRVSPARSRQRAEVHVTQSTPLTYRDAGVDIDAGNEVVERIKPLVRRTLRPEVLGGVGLFGGLFDLSNRYREPVLVSGTDGVGTKLKLAFQLNKHDSVGQDLVAMSVNDILVQGAEPLFFLDYFACGKLHVDTAATVIQGIAQGCELSGCALIGGETAEMPSMYPDGEYDLAGFAVGAVEKSRIIDGSTIRPGDVVLGLASSGAHSNGYSLIRRVIGHVAERDGLVQGSGPAAAASAARALLARPFDGSTLIEALMAPTRLYATALVPLLAEPTQPIKGLAHITGGGLVENIPRVLPEGCQAVVERSDWKRPAVFDWLQTEGRIADDEMARVFNCGIGMVVVVAASEADAVSRALSAAGETVYAIGDVRARPGGAPATIVV